MSGERPEPRIPHLGQARRQRRAVGGLAGWGVMLPSFDPHRIGTPPLLESAELAEDLGFDSLWVGDHLAYHAPVLEATCALSAVAARTHLPRVGYAVMLLALRHPVWAAKQIATLEAMAPGRVVLGVGVGGENPAEFEASGVPLGGRGKRLDDALQIVTALLRGEALEPGDPRLTGGSPALSPVPGRMLPLVVGGRSAKALSRAARLGDGWMGVWLDRLRLERSMAQLGEQAAAFGRKAPETILMLQANVGQDRRQAENEAEAWVGGQYGLVFEALKRWVFVGDEASLAESLSGFVEAGVSGFVLGPAGPDPLRQIERFAAAVALVEARTPAG
ncbi:MAG: LLM class flavin-dependent oxidoreductase [Acidimicrobiia bacterium]